MAPCSLLLFSTSTASVLRADTALESCHETRVAEKALLHTVLTALDLLYILLPGESLANYLSFFIGAGQYVGAR